LNNPVIDETIIRAYLLGRIRPEEELSAEFDQRMLADPEFSLLIDIVEDEILEEYVDGGLAAADIEAVENHFLTPPERQSKLRRMRLISRHIAGLGLEKATTPAEVVLRDGSPGRRRIAIFPSVRTWAEIAAGLVLVSCITYFWNQQNDLRLAVQQSRQELAQSNQAQAERPVSGAQAAVVTLNLVVPGLSRGDHALPDVHLPAGATTLHLSVALNAQAAGPLSVRLEQDAAVAWSSEEWIAKPVKGGAVLDVYLPPAIVPEGLCKLVVNVPGRGEILYWFKVTKA
jgi:hypothetical protein